MSVFGLLAMLCFLLLTSGLVLLYCSHNEDLALAKLLLFVLYLILAAEILIAIEEFPLYVVDFIIFMSFGNVEVARIALIVYALIIGFPLMIMLPKIKWKRFLTPSPAKLIITGILLIASMMYTEMWNGKYSFDDPSEYEIIREMYAPYDHRFFPTKYIKKDDEKNIISVYPFDASSATGKLDYIYRGEIFLKADDVGVTQLYFYPFTFNKTNDSGTPVSFRDETYKAEPVTSPADTSESPPAGGAASAGDGVD